MAARSKSYRLGRRGISAATMQNILLHEVDGMEILAAEGDPITIAERRTLAHPDRKSLSVRRQPKKRFRSSPASTKKRIKGSLRSAVTIALIGSSLIGVMSDGPRVSPTGIGVLPGLRCFPRRKAQARDPPAWRWSNSSIESQDPIDAALVPSLKRSSDVRHTLTALPALPQLGPLLRREPCPCMPPHSRTSNLAELKGVASMVELTAQSGHSRPSRATARKPSHRDRAAEARGGQRRCCLRCPAARAAALRACRCCWCRRGFDGFGMQVGKARDKRQADRLAEFPIGAATDVHGKPSPWYGCDFRA